MIKLQFNPDSELYNSDYQKLVVGIRRGPFLPPMLMLYDSLDQALFDFYDYIGRADDVGDDFCGAEYYKLCIYGVITTSNCFVPATLVDEKLDLIDIFDGPDLGHAPVVISSDYVICHHGEELPDV